MLPASAHYHKDTPNMHSQEALDAFTETRYGATSYLPATTAGLKTD